jgi:ribose 5-phosphate isomerase B
MIISYIGSEVKILRNNRDRSIAKPHHHPKERTMKKVAIGCDPNASSLKDVIKKQLEELGYECEDYGSDDPIYANVAFDVAEAVAKGRHDRGILVCGTGIGMCIAANKVPGAYAALCTDPYSTERSRKSNNANVMTLGAQTMGPEVAKTLVKIWMESEYTPGGRSEPKIKRIYDYAEKHEKT